MKLKMIIIKFKLMFKPLKIKMFTMQFKIKI